MFKKFFFTFILFFLSLSLINPKGALKASLLEVDQLEVEWWGKNMLADHVSVNVYNNHFSWLKSYAGLGYGGQTKNIMGHVGSKIGFNALSSFFHLVLGGTFSFSYLGSSGLHLGLGIDFNYFKRVNLNIGAYMLNNPNIATMGAYAFSVGVGYTL